MTPRRQALLGRYRARSLERTARMAAALSSLETGAADGELCRELARDLHTLKGDSTVVGIPAISDVTHAAEDLLLASNEGGAVPRAVCQRLREAVDRISRVLREELDPADAGVALADVVAGLAAGAKPTPEPGSTPGATAAPSAPDDPPSVPASLGATATSSVAGPRPGQTLDAASHSQGLPGAASPGAAVDVRASASAVGSTPTGPASSSDRWVQVPLARVDDLCDGISDLTANYRRLASLVRQWAPRSAQGQVQSLLEALDLTQAQLEETIGKAWSLRLVPLEPSLEELVAHAREVAARQGKRIRVQVQGDGVEVERVVLDALWEPLLHVVRNAVDHGIEPEVDRGEKPPEGQITIEARTVGRNLVLAVSDDGRGIDRDLVRKTAVERGVATEDMLAGDAELTELLFRQGFSTRKNVTELSGRGVGLDIVKSGLEALGGKVLLTSEPGKGTRLELTVPSTISKERTVIVACAGVLYGIPAGQVVEVVRLKEGSVEPLLGGFGLRFHGEMLAYYGLSAVLGGASERPTVALVIDSGGRLEAFGVAGIEAEQELLRRPGDEVMAAFRHIGGSAVMDDGRLVLLLRVGTLSRHARTSRPLPAASVVRRRRVLVVDDSATVRDLISEMLTDGGLEVSQAVNGADGLEAIGRDGLPDLILSDLEMPVMDGFELLRRVREKWKHLPVVLLTTRGAPEDRKRAAALGADAYVVKSDFQEASLLSTVNRLMTPRS